MGVKKLLKLKQLDWFVDNWLSEDDEPQLVKLAKNRYGSFVVEALFDSGDVTLVDRVSQVLTEVIEDLASIPHGGSHVATRLEDWKEQAAQANGKFPRFTAHIYLLKRVAWCMGQLAQDTKLYRATTDIQNKGSQMRKIGLCCACAEHRRSWFHLP